MIYNTEPARVDLECTQGDSIQMNFQITAELLSIGTKIYVQAYNVPEYGTPLDLTLLEMTVRREDGKILKSWSSVGTPAAITINPSTDGEFDLEDIDGFSESGFFNYDLQNTGSGFTGTLMSGIFHVKKQVTP